MTSESQRNRNRKVNMTNKTALDVDNTEYETVTFSAMLMSFLKIISVLLRTFSSQTIKIS